MRTCPAAEFQNFVAQWRMVVQEALKLSGVQVRENACLQGPLIGEGC